MFVILRSLMVLFCTVLGGVLAAVIYHLPGGTFLTRMPLPAAIVTGIIGGILLAAAAILIEHFVRRLSLVELAVVMAGLLIGTGIAFLVAHFQMLLPDFIQQALRPYNPYISVFKLALYVVFVYVGIVVGIRGKKEFNFFLPRLKYTAGRGMRPLLLDTSAIIDGRVLELYKTGFLRNKILLPQFILHELQQISDSQVSLTRTKGRRGLDTLKKIQDNADIQVEVTTVDYPGVPEVDDKLIRLAKEIDGAILTTDYNLEQVARIQNIQCLNVFGLANVLKAPFIPGEHVTIQIVKEGSEMNQGVGFLDDGTMIVVANAKPLIGQKVEVELVSMIQGASGRIFFAELPGAEQQQQQKGQYDRGYRGQDRRR